MKNYSVIFFDFFSKINLFRIPGALYYINDDHWNSVGGLWNDISLL